MTELLAIAKRRPYIIYGFISLVFILLMLSTGVVINSVPSQQLFLWQVVTGTLLLLTLMYQWVLLFLRLFNKQSPAHYKAHRWLGVACATLFALHAVSFGYGWTNTLAVVFILSALTGLLNREIVGYRKPVLYKLWYWSHVTLSVNLAPLTAVHIWVALVYEGF